MMRQITACHSLTLVIICWSMVLYSQTPSVDCSTAVAQQIAVGTTCNPIIFDINGALGTPAAPNCNGFTSTGEDGWAWFTATSTSTTIEYTHYNRDAQIHVYTGTCGALTNVGCADDWGTAILWATEEVTIPTVIGQIYFIRITRLTGTAGSMLGDLCVYSAAPIVNGDCSGAISIACGQSVVGTTTGSNADPLPTGCFNNNTSPGVWYTFTGDGSSTIISLCGSAYDTQLAVMTGSCAGLVCTAYNDDYCGLQSQVTVNTILGTTYYVFVHGFSGSSGAFTLSITCSTPPPPPCVDSEPNGCPDIGLGADIVMPVCEDPCIPLALNATYFEVGTTTSYTACSIPYAPYPYNTGTGFSIGVDDIWTPLINLPFNFCFFGSSYSQCVVGSNGVISFNPAYAGGYCPWAFTVSCPNPGLPLNAIFGAYHDIDPSIYCGASPCGDARYATFGVSPCRVFVVSFDNVPHFSATCNALRTSCEIVLYETTNVIEVFIENKPTCGSWNSGNALIGIQNATGTAGFSPSGRNTGPWTATNEGWRFTPNGPSTVNINWYEQGNPIPIGTGENISVCPLQLSQSYVATATYLRCDGTSVIVDDDMNITCNLMIVPVEWQFFEAILSPNQQHVSCEWTTTAEIDNDYFTVERSVDGTKWTDLHNIHAGGNSQGVSQYRFEDHSPLSGISYYRIRQTDHNGNFSHSDIRSVTRTMQVTPLVYPNPASDHVRISPWKDTYHIKLFDSNGRELSLQKSEADASYFNTGNLKTGCYLIEINDSQESRTHHQPLIILK